MAITREQDFREVRRLLGDPLDRRPTPDLIVSNMIAAEQYIMNRLSSTAKAWTHNTTSVSSVIDQEAYDVLPVTGSSFGKALFVYRDVGHNSILPIPFTELTGEITDQIYQFWIAQPAGESPIISADKVAFYRHGNTVRMRLYPIPVEVKTYTIVYASGALDWELFEWSDQPVMPEFSRYRQLLAALYTLAKCEWEGYSREECAAYRAELRGDLTREYEAQEEEFRTYIRHPQHESNISEVGFYWER